MDNEAIKKEKILEKLAEFKNRDSDYSDGKILGSMCTHADPFAKEVFYDFLDSNLGDPGLFKGTQDLEEMVIDEIGSFLSLEKSFGNVVTGGTEANLMAMRSARNIVKKEKGIGNIDSENYIIPEVIVPRSAHFSFKKAADLLNLKLIEADLDENYRVDVESVEKNISDNTMAIVGIAGTTELGMIDPIKELSNLAIEKNIYFHVDAAFGGFSIPFLNDFGYEMPPFDFSLEGVTSITIDPHKMGLALIPSGCIIFREKKYLDIMAVESPYLTTKKQSTIVGTRLGAPVAAIWAVMQHMGREGYGKNANECMINTEFLADALFKEDFELVTVPNLNIVAFTHPEIDTDDLANMLEKKGWKISVSSYPKAVRIVLMSHIKYTHLIDFLTSIREIKSDLNIR